MNTQQFLEQLLRFRSEATPDQFTEIFGKLAAHLWSQFNQVDCDVILFYGRLDNLNRSRFATWSEQQANLEPPIDELPVDYFLNGWIA